MLDDVLFSNVEELAVQHERQCRSENNLSEVSKKLEEIKQRRKLVESRPSYHIGSCKLWSTELSKHQEKMRSDHAAARERNERLKQDVKAAVDWYASLRSSAERRLSRFEAEMARKRYLAHVEALYPEWCREVERAAAEERRRQSSAALELQKQRLLAAERYAAQQEGSKAAAEEKQRLQRERWRAYEQRQRAEAGGGGDAPARGDLRGARGGSPPGEPPGEQSSPTVLQASPLRSSDADGLHDAIRKIAEILRSHGSPTKTEDPDMPPAAPAQMLREPDMPPGRWQPPQAPLPRQPQWQQQREHGGGDGPAPYPPPRMAGITMAVPGPDGNFQTVLVPVLSGGGVEADVSPWLSRHLMTPRGGGGTPHGSPMETSRRASFIRSSGFTVAPDKLNQQLRQIRSQPSRYHNSSSDATPCTSVSATPRESIAVAPGRGPEAAGPESADRPPPVAEDPSAEAASSCEGPKQGQQQGQEEVTLAEPEDRSGSLRVQVPETEAGELDEPYLEPSERAEVSSPFSGRRDREERGLTDPWRFSEQGKPLVLHTRHRSGSSVGSPSGNDSARRRTADKEQAPSRAPSQAPSLVMGIGGGAASSVSSSFDASEIFARASTETQDNSGRVESFGTELGDSTLANQTEEDLGQQTRPERVKVPPLQLDKAALASQASLSPPLEQSVASPTTTQNQGKFRRASSPNARSAPPLGIFGFGQSLGKSTSNKSTENRSARSKPDLQVRPGSSRTSVVTSIIHKAMNDDLLGDSDEDDPTFPNTTAPQGIQSTSSPVAPSGMASNIPDVNETSDEFDF